MKVINLLERVDEQEVDKEIKLDDQVQVGGSILVTSDGRSVLLNEGSLKPLKSRINKLRN
jgi:hypothetical protein